MSGVFGIDLGTTNSVIAELVDGRAVPIPVDGSPIVPSVVLYGPDGIVAGRAARNLQLQHPTSSVKSSKRHMGTAHRFDVGGRTVSPEEVSAEVLKALKRGAEAHTGRPIKDVVITVPAYFDDAQRRATLAAGELAGFHVLRLLNEPTSAALVYEQVPGASADVPENLLVYDLGGGTFDVSVLEVFQGVREVRAIAGNTHLGGDDFDELLTRRFLDTLKIRHGVDLREDPVAMARLSRLAEDSKIQLSTQTQIVVRQEFLATVAGQPIHLELPLTRRDLEELLLPLLESTVELARKAVRDAGLTPQDLNRICLVGGSTRVPLVRQLLEAAFPVPVHEEIDPDLAVGLGAAVQAGLLQGAAVSRILVDVAAHTLGIRTLDGESGLPTHFAPVLRRNTALPATRAEEFYTLVDNQEDLTVEVFQGEHPEADENTRIGSFDFPLLPSREGSPVRVEFTYDLNGVVKVGVSQPGTANQKTVALSVADAARNAAAPGAHTPSAVERKARRLLETLQGAPKAQLEALLSQCSGPDPEEAEAALLDFFLDHEDAGGAGGAG